MGWSSWNNHFVFVSSPKGDLRSPDQQADGMPVWVFPSKKHHRYVQEILSDVSSVCIEWFFVAMNIMNEKRFVRTPLGDWERRAPFLVFLIFFDIPQKPMSGLMQNWQQIPGGYPNMRPLSLTCALQAIDVWSIGCIYAELLGMLEGNKMEDRAPDQSSCRVRTALSCWSMQIIRERADAAECSTKDPQALSGFALPFGFRTFLNGGSTCNAWPFKKRTGDEAHHQNLRHPLSQPWLLSQPHPSADRTGGRCFLVLPAFLSHQTTSTSGENSEWFRIWGRVNTCGQTGPSEYGDKHPDPCLLFWRVRGWVPYPWIWIDFRGAVCLRPSCFLLITLRRRGLTIDITPEGNMISLPTQHMVSLWMHLSGTQTCLEHPQ